MTYKYISIKSVIYDISLTLDDRYWDYSNFIEFATRAARSLKLVKGLEDAVAMVEVSDHKAQLPEDTYYITQIARVEDVTKHTLFEPMRLATNPYHDSVCLPRTLMACPTCRYEYTISPSLVLTTNFSTGYVMLAYKRFPVDEEGDMLIPDDETVKEAILNYVLYRYWMAKYQMKEDGAEQRMRYHKQAWGTLKRAALSANTPDVATMENIMQQVNSLIPRQNEFQRMFLTLNKRENADF